MVTLIILNMLIIFLLDGEDDSGDGVPHARVPDWAWSAVGRQSGEEDYIVINIII